MEVCDDDQLKDLNGNNKSELLKTPLFYFSTCFLLHLRKIIEKYYQPSLYDNDGDEISKKLMRNVKNNDTHIDDLFSVFIDEIN
ncbi:CLUMA_CG009241, isoform A [Clunio marinus]|uniref:CLUMA_CG009241, isoform A n=1 Tax=Clunio marinus TaxID=568069 RepID=A0A1J1I688_9DIPT|nr:CLUMA_CG009241, isoform A [Clunio marinus]